jgi:hypothetical protein
MKKKVLSIITMFLVAVVSLFSLAGCESIFSILLKIKGKDNSERIEELKQIPWLEGYRLITQTCLVENGTLEFYRVLVEEELSEQGIEDEWGDNFCIYYDGIIYDCCSNKEKTVVYCTLINPANKQVKIVYTLDATTLDCNIISSAKLYAVTESDYVFYAYINGGCYWIFDRETNQLIEETREIEDREYTEIKSQYKNCRNYCESFTLNGKEYSVGWSDYGILITAEDYQFTISKDFVKEYIPQIFEIFGMSYAWTENTFFYDGYFYFVYYNNDNAFGATIPYANVPQIVIQANIEEQTVRYVGFTDSYYTESSMTVLGVSHIE